MKKQKNRFMSALLIALSCLSLMLAGCGASASETKEASSEKSDLYEQTADEGSQNYCWTADGDAATLYLMKDILSVSFQPAVGELK